jgi:hypothetical protein
MTGSLVGKWIGIKYVEYNYIEGDDTYVHMELWMDKEADNVWVKVNEFEDEGNQYPGGEESGSDCDGDVPCGGEIDQIFTWGSPRFTWAWHDCQSYNFKWMSVREIEPPK